ncbi:MAG: MMPL family transporter [Deltaproteobacteria bacterium]|nr:MMPL family transporter [Deltaproteobacteria bacterium]
MIDRARAAIALLLRHRRVTLAVMVISCALGVLAASRLALRLSYFELLPQDAGEVRDLAFVSKKTGGQGYLIVEIAGGSRDDRIARGRALATAIAGDHEIAHVDFERELDPQLAPWLLDDRALARVIAELDARVEQGVEAALSLDGAAPASAPAVQPFELPRFIESATATYLIAKPAFVADSIPRMQSFIARMRSLTASAAPLTVTLGGPMIFNLAFVESIQRDLQRMTLVAAVLVALALWWATRSVRASVLLLLPVAVGISVSLGAAWLAIGHLTIISGLLVALLAGLGVESGIHVYLRWREQGSTDVARAAAETLPGSLTGALTNATAFFVLIGCELQAFREFGVIAGLGILLTFASTFAFLPALLSLLPPRPATAERAVRALPLRRRTMATVLGLGALTAMLGFAFSGRLRIDRDLNALHGAENPDQAGLRAAAALGTTLMPTIAWVPSANDAITLTAIVQKQIAPGSAIASARSLPTLVADDTPARRAQHARLAVLLKRVPKSAFAGDRDAFIAGLSAAPPLLAALPVWLTRIYTPSDHEGALVVIESTEALTDAGDLDAFVAALDADVDAARAAGIDVRVLSENRIAARIFRLIQRDGPFIAWATVVAVALALLVLLRRLRAVALLMLPLAVGAGTGALVIIACDLPLNFINLAIVPSLLTMAIDNVVHMHHRFQHGEPLPELAWSSGKAVLAASAVNFSGYAAALVAKFFGLWSLGALATIGVLAMIFATVPWFVAMLFFLPQSRANERT